MSPRRRVRLPALLAAPTAPYEIPLWGEPKVGLDQFAAVAKALYSLPLAYRRRRLRARADAQAVEALWPAVPEQMRLSLFARGTAPPQYAGAFCHDGTWRAGVDLSHLPEPMRREVAWCIFRIIELGGTIPTPALSMLVRRLGEVMKELQVHSGELHSTMERLETSRSTFTRAWDCSLFHLRSISSR